MKNEKSASLSSYIIRLWYHFTPRRHKQFILLLLLIILASIAEMISIGTVLPFLSILTAPEKVFEMPYIQPFIRILGVTSPGDLLFPVTLIFILLAVFAGLTRLLLLWVSTRLSFAAGADLSLDIYRKTLYQPYKVHVSRNSSEVMSGIISKANGLVFTILLPVNTIVSSVIIIIAITSILIILDPLVSLISFTGFGLAYGVIAFVAKKRLEINGKIVSQESTKVYKTIQEGLGGIRDVLLDATQDVYSDIFRVSDQKFRKAQSENAITGASPRFVMEAFGMIMIALFAYFLSKEGNGITAYLPLLGSLALGAQRLLPTLQQGYNAWTSVKGSEGMMIDVLELLDQPLPHYANMPSARPLAFNKSIQIRDLSFRYNPADNWVLKNLNISILKGARTGFIGKTGSGKSTLLDLIMALLEPSDGKLLVDGNEININNARSWQANIAHVPQSIYLADATIFENIAFGIPKENIDMEKVKEVAVKAQLSTYIDGLKEGYHSFVGERGIRLSGGQRQRIGIARALYKNASVIVFDEATSALDNETEQAVMSAIETLSDDLTILIIAHRLSTVKNCDKIIELKDGEVVREGKYNELFGN